MELGEAEHIYIIGYSLPDIDAFFNLLYALGTVGDSVLRRFRVYNPDKTGSTERRFKALLGPGARARFEYRAMKFKEAIADLQKDFEPTSWSAF